MPRKEKPPKTTETIPSELQDRKVFEEHKAELLTFYEHPTRLHEWSKKYPRLADKHIHRAVQEIINHLKRTNYLLDNYNHVIDNVLKSFDSRITLQIRKYKYPTEAEIEKWKEQFPYLSRKQIVRFFRQKGEELQHAPSIFVSLIFETGGERELHHLTFEQRLAYFHTHRDEIMQKERAKDEAKAKEKAEKEKISVDNEQLFLLGVYLKTFFRQSAKSVTFLSIATLGSLFSLAVLINNPTAFGRDTFAQLLCMVTAGVPVPVLLYWVGKQANKEKMRMKARIVRTETEIATDPSNSTIEEVGQTDVSH